METDGLFLDVQVLTTTFDLVPWFTNFANYVVSNIISKDLSFQQRNKFLHDMNKYFWDKPHLFHLCAYNIIQRYVPEVEMLEILQASHSFPMGGYHAVGRIAQNFLQSGYYC